MRQEPLFRKYLDFSPTDGGTLDDEKMWIDSFLYLLKKLTLREYKNSYQSHYTNYSQLRALIKDCNNAVSISNHNNIKLCSSNHTNTKLSKSSASNILLKRLLLKSPIHAARIPLLKRLFPSAKFIYLHRDPYEVFQSEAHMINTAYWFCYFNIPTHEQILNFIYWQFESMWLKYKQAKSVPVYSKDIYEVPYSDLIASNKNYEHIKGIYKFLNMDWTECEENLYKEKLSHMTEYKVNRHVELPTSIRETIQSKWKDYIEYYHY